MLTITYRGPTDHKVARMECKGYMGKVSVPWDHALNPRDMAERAVRAYLAKYDDEGPRGTWIVADNDAHGWVAVRVGVGSALVMPFRAVAPWDVQVQVRS